ncbi:MAG: dipeptide epimerase [Bacteroidota bacterium]
MQLKLHPLILNLKEAFTISRDTYTHRKTLIIELVEGQHRGFGEASEHAYYQVSQKVLVEKASSMQTELANYSFDNPEKFNALLQQLLPDFPFLQCAFDNAAHDLFGQIQQQSCREIWNLPLRENPKSSYTLSIDRIDSMIAKVKSTDFDLYKVKLGTSNDLEILKQIRKHTDAILRVDANCAWTAAETIHNSKVMKNLGVEFIEQPLPADDWSGMKKVYENSELPIIADEACRNEADLKKMPGHFHGINVKLMKCGGLTPALKMSQPSRSLQLKVMCGCMVESSVGIAAIAQLLPLLDYVDMDGPLLLADDPAHSVNILSDGSIAFPNRPGLGIHPIRF